MGALERCHHPNPWNLWLTSYDMARDSADLMENWEGVILDFQVILMPSEEP